MVHKSGTLAIVHSAYINGTSNGNRVHTVAGLIPRTEYSFRVNAVTVSDSGEGPDATIDNATAIPEGAVSI